MAADDRERGAEFVAGIGDELAEPVFALLPFGSAVSTCVSMWLTAAATRPTSVRWSPPGTRSVSLTSPKANGRSETRNAVAVTRSKGCRDRRTAKPPITPMTTATARKTMISVH